MFSGGWSLVSAASRAMVFAAGVVMVIALDVPEPVGVDGSFVGVMCPELFADCVGLVSYTACSGAAKEGRSGKTG